MRRIFLSFETAPRRSSDTFGTQWQNQTVVSGRSRPLMPLENLAFDDGHNRLKEDVMASRSINESPQVYARLAGGSYVITVVAGSIALVSGSGRLRLRRPSHCRGPIQSPGTLWLLLPSDRLPSVQPHLPAPNLRCIHDGTCTVVMV